jgi:parallel beta-helix repeat protein
MCAAVVLGLTLGSVPVFAGPITPPPGPVTGTYKTLTEVEPRIAINATNTPGDVGSVYRINQPGSYYLTGNVTGVAGKAGIFIGASNVTVDLNGFALISPTGVATTDGVASLSALNITIKNGALDGWDGDGIDLSNNTGSVRVENVSVRSVGGAGVKVNITATVVNCTVWGSAAGILAGDTCVIERCTVENGGLEAGISVQNNGIITDCAASDYDTGIACGLGGRISSSTSARNKGYGIIAWGGSTVVGCTAFENALSGFNMLGSVSITDSASHQNGRDGFTGSVGSTYVGCVATENDMHGFQVSGMLRDCLAQSNAGSGFYGLFRTSIIECRAVQNAGRGIDSWGGNQILRNICSGNGGSGILVSFPGGPADHDRIEGNTLNDNDKGISIRNAGNIVVGNTCGGNGVNYDIVAGNYFGPVISRVGAATAGFTGNSAAGNLTTTDPWANFSY